MVGVHYHFFSPPPKSNAFFVLGLINLMVNETQPYFPITLQFDERRLTNQFRFEFQNIIVIGILLMPYRHLAGSNLKKSEICKLKSIYTTLLKSDQQVSCRYLALHACEAAHVNTETAQFWEEWLSQQLQPTSSIFKIFYKRISAQLLSCLLNTSVDIMDVSDEVEQLGLKLKHIAKLNLDVYGVLYKEIVSQLVK
jgi:hypothetical protein